jgi:hypothetical protein
MVRNGIPQTKHSAGYRPAPQDIITKAGRVKHCSKVTVGLVE